ncbi:MAG: T9SS type A sorting domain-containing protein [Bacteroidia bacterium]
MKTTLLFTGKFLILPLMAILFPLLTFAQWSAPVNISPHSRNASMNENMGPCMAVSNDTIHVIWSDKTTLGVAIYYTRSVDTGHTWSAPIAITDTASKAAMPSIAVSGRNIHVVWWDSLNEKTNFTSAGLFGNSSFYIHSLDGGNTWVGKTCIDSSSVFWPGIAVSGSTVLVSLDKGGFDSTIVWLTKSTDNGNTFSAEQQVSTRTGKGRSEDQSTATDGKYIHMTWNDNRSGTMQIYYRRSTDMGATWNPEVAITSLNSYTTMVSLDSGHVDIAHGMQDTYWNSYIRQSNDSGATWNSDKQVTGNTITGSDEEYPFMVRDGLNLYMVSLFIKSSAAWDIYYSQSTDGGTTWMPQVLLGNSNFSATIALTCPVLHVAWPDSGKIFYTRNPTGAPSCPSVATGIENVGSSSDVPSLYPNPAKNNAIITFPEAGTRQIDICDITGRIITDFESTGKEYNLNCNGLSDGMYFIKVVSGVSTQVIKFIKE